VGPPRGPKPCQQTYSSMGSSLHGSAGPGRCLFHRGPPWAAGGQPASPWSSSLAAGEKSLLWHLEHLLPLLLHRPWYLQSCFSHIISLLTLHCHFTAVFFPLLKYVIPEALPPSLIGLASVHLRAGWHWLCQTWGKLLETSHRSHHYSPPVTKTLPLKPTTSGYEATQKLQQQKRKLRSKLMSEYHYGDF